MQQRTNKFSESELIKAYKELHHLGKLAVKFNVPPIEIWRKCKILGLTFKNGGGNMKIPLQEILEGKHNHYPTNKLKKRLIKENILTNKCDECGLTSWNEKQIILQLDHINGNGNDHRLNNLRLLCPNCHSQTDTWCGKNNIGKRK